MRKKTTKKQILISLVFALLVVMHLPIIAVGMIALLGRKSNIGAIAKISKAIDDVIAIMLMPLTKFIEYGRDILSLKSEKVKEDSRIQMEDDAYFNYLLEEENESIFYSRMIDGIQVLVDIYEYDYSNISDLYTAYQDGLDLIDELRYTVPDHLKKLMVDKKMTIRIFSESTYSKVAPEDSMGYFEYKYCNIEKEYVASIKLKLTNDLIEDKDTLYHEVGHFLDLVDGANPENLEIMDYESSSNKYMIEQIMEKEAHIIGRGANKSVREFIACAYAYKLAGRDMSQVPLTDNLMNYMTDKSLLLLSESIEDTSYDAYDEENFDAESYCDHDENFENDDDFEEEYSYEEYEYEEDYEYEYETDYEDEYEYEANDEYEEEVSEFDLEREFPPIDFDTYLEVFGEELV